MNKKNFVLSLVTLALVSCSSDSSSGGAPAAGQVKPASTAEHNVANCPDFTGNYIFTQTTTQNGKRDVVTTSNGSVRTEFLSDGVKFFIDDGRGSKAEERVVDARSYAQYPDVDSSDTISKALTYVAICTKNKTIEAVAYQNSRPYMLTTYSKMKNGDIQTKFICLDASVTIGDQPGYPSFCALYAKVVKNGVQILTRR